MPLLQKRNYVRKRDRERTRFAFSAKIVVVPRGFEVKARGAKAEPPASDARMMVLESFIFPVSDKMNDFS